MFSGFPETKEVSAGNMQPLSTPARFGCTERSRISPSISDVVRAFAWNQSRLVTAEQQFLVGGGVYVGAMKHLGEEDRNVLTLEAMSTDYSS